MKETLRQKSPNMEVFFPHFPVFRLNKEIYLVNLRIQSEYGKIRTREDSVFGHFSRSETKRHPYSHVFPVLA